MFNLPKFTIRQLLLAMIAVAIVLASLGNAVNGGTVGSLIMISLAMGIVTLVMLSIVYWFWYLIATLIDWLIKRRSSLQTRKLTIWQTGLIGLSMSMTGSAASVNAQNTPALSPASIDYQINIDHDFPNPQNEGGYVPVRIKLEVGSRQPVSRDRHFTVFYDKGYYRYSSFTIKAPIVIEAGQTAATVELNIPSINSVYSDSYQIQICEGKNLSQPIRSSRIFIHNDWRGNQPVDSVPPTLLISSKLSPQFTGNTFSVFRGQNLGSPLITSSARTGELPNLDMMIDYYRAPQTNQAYTTGTFFPSAKIHACHPDRLPESWLGWTALERILISLPDYQTLMEKNASASMILKHWVAAGGLLIIFDVADLSAEANRCWESLIHQAFNDRVAERERRIIWKELAETPLPPEMMQDALTIESTSNNPNYTAEDASLFSNVQNRASLIEKIRREPDRWWKEHTLPSDDNIEAEFLLRNYLLGGIGLIQSDFSDWDNDHWLRFECAIDLLPTHLKSVFQNANTNGWSDEFAIEGVGEPPLRLFQILLSSFLFLAGPVVYITLLKTGNMQWLFVLVPAISITASLGLMANALLVDGLGTHARVRSVTWLDQTSQTAVTQARLSCYSNLTPSGQTFYTDTAALLASNRSSESQNKLRWRQEDNRYIVSGGEFIARQPFQIVSLRSHPMSQSVRWMPAEVNKSDTAQTKTQKSSGKLLNQLGTDAAFILARTEDGLVYVQNLANQQAGEAIAIEADLANELLTKLAAEISPTTMGSRRLDFQNNPRRFYYNYQAPSYTKGSIFDVGEHQAISELKANRGVELLKEPNSYVAILEDFPLLDNQVTPLPFKNRIHVVIGKW